MAENHPAFGTAPTQIESNPDNRVKTSLENDEDAEGKVLEETQKRKRGRPKLTEKEREMRAELVLARRIQRRSMEEIQQEFHISRATAYRALSYAKRHELYEQARDTLVALVPKALGVYDAALDKGNVEVAKNILEAMGLGGKHVVVHAPIGEGEEIIESYEAIRARIQRKIAKPSADQETAARQGDVLDADIVLTNTEAAPTEGSAGSGTVDSQDRVEGRALQRRDGT